MIQIFKFVVLLVSFVALPMVTNAATIKKVTFDSHGQTLVGYLHLPDGDGQDQQRPGVVVTGAWTTVKEQMPGTYAGKLAAQGYVALTFDFRGWGQSHDAVKYLEDPKRKTEDINAAVNYLATRPEVDQNRIAGLGICASAGYMSDAALQNDHIKAVALVAPWLHDAEIVNAVYGGEAGVKKLIQISRDAQTASEPVILEAASMTNENAVMYQAPYYTETDRGMIPEYDNKFNAASWEGWLTYDAIKTADKLEKPTLLVHSEAAAIPQGAKEYAQRMGRSVSTVWFENTTQFDFYDKPEIVLRSVTEVVRHFESTLK
ncbi:MAG: alpha/beta hydrolase [Desulfosarcinaceae bacterium]|nr:alpha/beta hydrolase [Desulfosarcinaceae bacterium]